jgi:hypothetical protein
MTETTETIPDNWPAARYAPPLERTDFEELVRIAHLFDPDAEAGEVTFESGKQTFVIRSLEFEGEGYVHLEPGEYLVYSPNLKQLGIADEEEVKGE